MNFNYYNEQVILPELDYQVISAWLEEVIESNGKSSGSVTFIFCDDPYLLDINKKFLNHDYFTDIITFNYSSSRIISGDLFVSLDTVLSNSVLYGFDFRDELFRVMVHGVLHLLGWDDQTEKDRSEMRQQEDFWLGKVSLL